MLAAGLVRGTSGNISARPPGEDWCLLTPSGVDYELMRPEADHRNAMEVSSAKLCLISSSQ